jgi:Zn-finger nucleic acid-binding protein
MAKRTWISLYQLPTSLISAKAALGLATVMAILVATCGLPADVTVHCERRPPATAACQVVQTSWFATETHAVDANAITAVWAHVRTRKNSASHTLVIESSRGAVHAGWTTGLDKGDLERVITGLKRFLADGAQREFHAVIAKDPTVSWLGLALFLVVFLPLLLILARLGWLVVDPVRQEVRVLHPVCAPWRWSRIPFGGVTDVFIQKAPGGRRDLTLVRSRGDPTVTVVGVPRHQVSEIEVVWALRAALGLPESLRFSRGQDVTGGPPKPAARKGQPDTSGQAGDPCPRCRERCALSSADVDLARFHCLRCGGLFLARDGAQQLLERHLGLAPDVLRSLSAHHGGRSIWCPGCTAKMALLQLKGRAIDLCLTCGGLWLDHGELTAISGGRFRERNDALDVDTTKPVVAPGSDLTRVAERSLALDSVGLGTILFLVISLAAFVVTVLFVSVVAAFSGFVLLLLLAAVVLAATRVRFESSPKGLHRSVFIGGVWVWASTMPASKVTALRLVERRVRTQSGSSTTYYLVATTPRRSWVMYGDRDRADVLAQASRLAEELGCRSPDSPT